MVYDTGLSSRVVVGSNPTGGTAAPDASSFGQLEIRWCRLADRDILPGEAKLA